MFWSVAGILTIGVIITMIDRKLLVQHKKDGMLFLFILLVAISLSMLMLFNVELVNPLELIKMVYSPISQLIYGNS
jgi:hypothetical protein